MFSQEPLQTKDKVHWNQPHIVFNLGMFVVIKFILTSVSISCPIPAGVFTPTFVLGAVFGRLYGYVLRQIFGKVINETAYAIIGAACLTSSVTRTISVAMIVFEINGELSYMIPVLLGVLLSYAISNSFCVSIFDVLLDMKDLPYLPAIRFNENYSLKASDMMNRNFQHLFKNSTLSDIALILFQLKGGVYSKIKSIPVLRSKENQVLLFSVEIQSLRRYMFEYYLSISHTFHGEAKESLNNYFYKVNAISQKDISSQPMKEGDQVLIEPHSKENYAKTIGKYFLLLSLGFINLRNLSFLYISFLLSMISNNILAIDKEAHETMSIKEFHDKHYNKDSSIEEEPSELEADRFWNTFIDWEDENLEIDKAPFTVMKETPLAKIHFLFTMLGIENSQLFIISEGHLVGIITKDEVLRRRTHGHDNDDSAFIPPNLGTKDHLSKTEILDEEGSQQHELYFEGRELHPEKLHRKSSL